jgi:regulatory protein
VARLAMKPSLKGRALRLLSQREHSRKELEQKLKPHEETPGELAEALDFLAAKDFINEKRVVESVVNRRSTKLGAARVRQELMAKGLPADDIADAVETMRGTELERALVVWRKKFGAPASDASERAKQVRFLVSRGFAAEVVRRVVAGADEL